MIVPCLVHRILFLRDPALPCSSMETFGTGGSFHDGVTNSVNTGERKLRETDEGIGAIIESCAAKGGLSFAFGSIRWFAISMPPWINSSAQ